MSGHINVADRQTDGRTTYDSKTELALRASGGKNKTGNENGNSGMGTGVNGTQNPFPLTSSPRGTSQNSGGIGVGFSAENLQYR